MQNGVNYCKPEEVQHTYMNHDKFRITTSPNVIRKKMQNENTELVVIIHVQ